MLAFATIILDLELNFSEAGVGEVERRKDEFIRNLRGADEGCDFQEAFLTDIFLSIQTSPILRLREVEFSGPYSINKAKAFKTNRNSINQSEGRANRLREGKKRGLRSSLHGKALEDLRKPTNWIEVKEEGAQTPLYLIFYS